MPTQVIDRVVKHSLVGGELLQRADFSARADDRDEIIWLEFLIDELARLLANPRHTLERHSQIVDDESYSASSIMSMHYGRNDGSCNLIFGGA